MTDHSVVDDDENKAPKKKDVKGKKVKIDLEPTIDEAKSSTAVITFGRMQPPTIGHEKLINAVLAKARSVGGQPLIYVSQTHDQKKNPLPYKLKVKVVQAIAGRDAVPQSKARHMIEILKELDGQYDNVIVVVGQDRVREFNTLINKYNGKEYNFTSLSTASAGDRDPDADGVEGISGTKVRQFVADGDFDSFAAAISNKVPLAMKKTMFTAIKGTLKEDLDEALNVSQRRKKAITMKRNKAKVQRGKKRMARRAPTRDAIKKRARRAAVRTVRTKVGGKKAAGYSKMSAGQKMMIDKRVEKRKKLVGTLSKRLMPKTRNAAMRQRLSNSYDIDQDITIAEAVELFQQIDAWND